ncbi:MAG: hypothetical protein WB608_16825 [Terracidiphilus sp.]
MSDELEIQSAFNTAEAPDHPTHNPAIACCCEAYNARLRAARASQEHMSMARIEARQAYCRAMPPLCSSQNISDFVACVAYGILIEAIRGSDAARLLSAAQIANRVRPCRPAH